MKTTYKILFAGLLSLYGVKGQSFACTTTADCATLQALDSTRTYVCSPNPNVDECTYICSVDADCTLASQTLGITATCVDYSGTKVCDADTSCTTSTDCVTNGLAGLGYSYCDTSSSTCVAPPTAAPTTRTPTAANSNVTPVPTVATTAAVTCVVANDCVNAGSAVYHCDPANDPMISGECQEQENACYARCEFEAQIAAASSLYGSATIDGYITQSYGDRDTMFAALCAAGNCPTSSPTTTRPTLSVNVTPLPTPIPTAKPTFDCTTCSSLPSDPYVCSTAGDATLYNFFPMDCEQADNECAARCMIDEQYEVQVAALDATTAALVENQVQTTYGGTDGLFLQYCAKGTCAPTTPTTAAPAVATTPAPTAETPCTCDNGCWHATGCSDDDGTGCSILLDATLDFCLIDDRWPLNTCWNTMRSTFVSTLAALVPSRADFCDDADLKIEEWSVAYLTDDAQNRANAGPANQAACSAYDFDAICGSSRDTPQFRISMKVGFFCSSSCADTQSVMLSLLNVLNTDKQCSGDGCDDEFGGQVVSNCMTQSTVNDPVCAGTNYAGFGGVAFEVQEATLAYRDESGNVVGETVDLTSGTAASMALSRFACLLAVLVACWY